MRQLLHDGMSEDCITVSDLTDEYWCGHVVCWQVKVPDWAVTKQALWHTQHHNREFGKDLFMDRAKLESEACGIQAVFGSFTDPAFVSAKPPVGPLGRLAGRVDVLWAGAVLHVLCKADVEAFAAHAHAMLALDGVWIGVGCSVCPSCACCPCMHVGHAHLLGSMAYRKTQLSEHCILHADLWRSRGARRVGYDAGWHIPTLSALASIAVQANESGRLFRD